MQKEVIGIKWEDVAGKWVGHPDLTDERKRNIRERLIPAVSRLKAMAEADGVVFRPNPKTGTIVSGETLGGFRPQAAKVGAPLSNHKHGFAVDLFDPLNEIDAWCMANLAKLAEAGIWIEHPDDTPSWSHWQCQPPRSMRRVFKP